MPLVQHLGPFLSLICAINAGNCALLLGLCAFLCVCYISYHINTYGSFSRLIRSFSSIKPYFIDYYFKYLLDVEDLPLLSRDVLRERLKHESSFCHLFLLILLSHFAPGHLFEVGEEEDTKLLSQREALDCAFVRPSVRMDFDLVIANQYGGVGLLTVCTFACHNALATKYLCSKFFTRCEYGGVCFFTVHSPALGFAQRYGAQRAQNLFAPIFFYSMRKMETMLTVTPKLFYVFPT